MYSPIPHTPLSPISHAPPVSQSDFNKDAAVEWVSTQFANPDAYDLFWGTSVHWYAGALLDQMDLLHQLYPNKRIMATESCICPDVRLDDWGRGEQYMVDILGDLNHWSVGYTDWNLLLAHDGGPTHVGESCDAAVIARFDLKPVVLHYQPMYYALGHFSRFLPRGSRRVHHNITAPTKLLYTTWLRQAEAAPMGGEEVVVVVMNGEDTAQQLAVQAGPRYASLEVPPRSWHTLTFPAALLTAEHVDTE
jgi:glucosylceramidase